MQDPLVRKQLPKGWIDLAVGDPERVRINLAIDYGSLEQVVRNLKGE